jgi:hypothetical protein
MAHPLNRKVRTLAEGFWVENAGDVVILKTGLPGRPFGG